MSSDDQGQAVPEVGAASPRPQDVLADHQPAEYGWGIEGCRCGWDGPSGDCDHEAEHAAHQAVAWREVCTIHTVEQLDALPFLAVVREVFRPAPVSGCDYGGVWERRTSGWEALSGSVMPPGYTSPRLPALLVWHPEWVDR